MLALAQLNLGGQPAVAETGTLRLHITISATGRGRRVVGDFIFWRLCRYWEMGRHTTPGTHVAIVSSHVQMQVPTIRGRPEPVASGSVDRLVHVASAAIARQSGAP